MRTQIARTVARALWLNEDLTEALCLAHDIGHPPFGHSGEDALQAAMAEAGGFDLVAGNPPWIRLHRIPARIRARLREEFRVFRGSAWTAGAEAAHAAAQILVGRRED